MATISLKNNEQILAQFQYGNCAKMISRKVPGTHYYTWTLEGGDKLAGDAYLLNAIRNNWPGRGGALMITKLNAQTYEIEVRMKSPKGIYPLELTQWDDTEKQFVQIGTWPSEAATDDDTGEEHPQTSSERRVEASADVTPESEWKELEDYYRECVKRARVIWEEEMVPFDEIPGDHAQSVQDLAVSMAIEGKKMGLMSPTANQKLVEGMEGEELGEVPSSVDTISPGASVSDREPPPEEESDLPF